MLLTGFLIRFTCYLEAPCYFQALFFDLHVISRPPFSTYMLFTAPFLIYMLFTGPLFRFPCYLQTPYLMYVLGSLPQFICHLQAPFYDLYVFYRFPLSIYVSINMLLTCYLQ